MTKVRDIDKAKEEERRVEGREDEKNTIEGRETRRQRERGMVRSEVYGQRGEESENDERREKREQELNGEMPLCRDTPAGVHLLGCFVAGPLVLGLTTAFTDDFTCSGTTYCSRGN